ncbi:MAG: GNAT family N-acetyltransferase [Cyanobacteria bacterium P01_D01_bin.50]
MKFHISLLDTSFHDRESFDCGKPQLNNYLKKIAGQDAKKGYSKTFAATTEVNKKKIVGYYCTSASSIELENIPENLSKRLPKYPAPAMLIGRLAVDKGMQGQRLGETLLMHALNKAVRATSEIAIFAVRVDALDEEPKKFYLHYGFKAFKDKKFSLLLPMKTILTMFGEN